MLQIGHVSLVESARAARNAADPLRCNGLVATVARADNLMPMYWVGEELATLLYLGTNFNLVLTAIISCKLLSCCNTSK